MFPLAELSAAHDVVCSFVSDKALLHEMLTHLLFVTCHIQMGLGHIGIAFLCAEQRRKNMLIRMDVDGPAGREGGEERRDRTLQNGASRKEQRRPDQTQPHNGTASKSARDATGAGRNGAAAAAADPSLPFRRSAPAFILLSVFAYMNVRNRIHRAVRIRGPFDHDAHLTALAADGAAGPEVYGASVDTVVDTAYDILNRKLFSLPKLLLLPRVISRQPLLLAKIFPFILLTDVIKGRIVASVTDRVERFQREARDVDARRRKGEQFDMKNAELLRRSGAGAMQFTQRRWDELTLDYQAKMAAGELLRRTRGYFRWLQRNFVFVVLIDCALAKLLAGGSIVVSEIFVFTRAIEDVVDLLLIRSRSESELA